MHAYRITVLVKFLKQWSPHSLSIIHLKNGYYCKLVQNTAYGQQHSNRLIIITVE